MTGPSLAWRSRRKLTCRSTHNFVEILVRIDEHVVGGLTLDYTLWLAFTLPLSTAFAYFILFFVHLGKHELGY